jgi:hypothetical protein
VAVANSCASQFCVVSRETLSSLCQNDLSVVLVLDPNWQLCFEQVDVNEFTRTGLLSWIHGLRDPFTKHSGHLQGDYLKVRWDLVQLD